MRVTMERDELQPIPKSIETEDGKNVRKSKRLSHTPHKFIGEKQKKTLKEIIEWKLGDYCEASDETKSWFKCKIIQVEENRVKIHFCGWNSRYDKWLDKSSNELRHEKKSPPATKSKIVETGESDEAKSHVKIENGTEVMAKWIDETFYPAKTTRSLIKNDVPYYEVKFLDGVRKTIRFSNLRLPSDEELKLFKPVEKKEIEKEESVTVVENTDTKIEVQDKSVEEEKRRAEAELLLAIQEPVLKVIDQSPKLDEPNLKSDEPVTEVESLEDKKEQIEEKKEEMKGPETPQEPENLETKIDEPEKQIEEKKVVKPEQNDIRKSLRVKRLRTFRDEIVFDSPASKISYNLASIKQDTPEPEVKRKKTEDKQNEEEKEANRKRVQNYFKSLKLFKSNKRSKNKANESLKENFDENSEVKLDVDENDEEERRKRKKLKKDKRKLFEEIIKNSKIQLERNQQIIAKQLEEHSLKKSQKKLLKILKKQQKEHEEVLSSDQSLSSPMVGEHTENMGPICCTFENCTKTFRKQSLLDYHLKYHHYVDSNQPKTTTTTKTSKKVGKKKKLNDEQDDYTYGNSLKSDDETDPYEVIHCKCGNNVNKGFMIQCEICLCWQHGDCESIRSNKQVPESYLCWVCSEPTNNLKNLKYQSWINTRMESELKLKHSDADSGEIKRLKLLNECSKQYYGLNLLMYTLEFEMSIFNQLTTKTRPEQEHMDQSIDNNNNEVEYDDETYDQLDRLSQNIAHLQTCLTKQFEEFNSKLDEYESTYPMDENLDLQNFDLDQLYNQLQSII